MIDMIKALIADGFAYEKDGHVLFRVANIRRLRQAVRAVGGRHDRGRAGRSRALQGRSDGFCPVEAVI